MEWLGESGLGCKVCKSEVSSCRSWLGVSGSDRVSLGCVVLADEVGVVDEVLVAGEV